MTDIDLNCKHCGGDERRGWCPSRITHSPPPQHLLLRKHSRQQRPLLHPTRSHRHQTHRHFARHNPQRPKDITMPDVYIADEPHLCNTPPRHSRPAGSIWRCDECGTYWHFGYTDDSWGPIWHEVRWWHRHIRRQIRELGS